MDTLPSGDMNDLERRLTNMRPAGDGLNADQMLFAAGRDSVRRGWGRVAWPIACGCLVLASVVLAFGMVHEHSERLELAAKLDRQAPSSPDRAPGTYDAPPTEPSTGNRHLVIGRAIEDGLDSWPGPSNGESPEQAPSSRGTVSAHSLRDFLDQ